MITRTITNGIFRTCVSYDKAVPSCPYGSCGIMEQTNAVLLVSYTTVCGELTNDGWLTADHYSSNTIAKHINAFIKDYVRGAARSITLPFDNKRDFRLFYTSSISITS